jgi:hypothetical protein
MRLKTAYFRNLDWNDKATTKRSERINQRFAPVELIFMWRKTTEQCMALVRM